MNPAAVEFTPTASHAEVTAVDVAATGDVEWVETAGDVPVDEAAGAVVEASGWQPVLMPVQTSMVGAPLSRIVFDPVHELVWTGSSDGAMACFHTEDLSRRVSFRAHASPVCELIPGVDGIASVSEDTIRYHSSGGVLRLTFRSPELQGVHAATLGNHHGTQLVLGADKNMLTYDITRNCIVRQVESVQQVTCMARGRSLCCGTESGIVQFRDPRAKMSISQQVMAHVGGVNTLDIKDHLVLSCGFSSRATKFKPARADAVVQVLDERMMRLLPPLPFAPGAVAGRFVPSNASLTMACLVSADGQFQFVDAGAPDPTSFDYYHAMVAASVEMVAISATGQVMALGDAYGGLHLWSEAPDSPVNGFSEKVESVVPFPSYPELDMNEHSPLNLVEMEAVEDERWLLSSDVNVPVEPPKFLPPVDTSLVHELKWNDYIGYAPVQGTLTRNSLSTVRKFTTARKATDKSRREKSSKLQQLRSPHIGNLNIAKPYAKVKIKIPKFGLDSFDFSAYNTTRFAGLNNVLPNSHFNAALQMFYFMPGFRMEMLNHLCGKESCLSCELGFLFHMLDHLGGQTAEPRNLLRVLRQIPEASALGLLEDSMKTDTELVLAPRIQDFDRFLMGQIKKERGTTHSSVSELFGFQTRRVIECLGGKHSSVTEIEAYNIKLRYPKERVHPSFADLLSASATEEEPFQRVWCDRCKTYEPTRRSKCMSTLPTVLNVHCNVNTDAELDIWRTPSKRKTKKQRSWLPLYLRLWIDETRGNMLVVETVEDGELQPRALDFGGDGGGSGTVVATESGDESKRQRHRSGDDDGDDDEKMKVNVKKKSGKKGVLYRLQSVVAHVLDPPEHDSSINAINGEHLVAHVRVPEEYGPTPECPSRWHIFNDFVISKSTAEEATRFDYIWKQPCIVQYARKMPPTPKRKNPILPDVLWKQEPSLSRSTMRKDRTFSSLQPYEKLTAGTRVAIDCEFVLVQKEESKVNVHGKKIITTPSRLSLGRVSVIRGEGPKPGEPFIDDYILTSETVVDYLTQYSGIEQGDLDPQFSPHHLTTLKSAYVKLRALVDLGVKFIGHGLKKDFQMINIAVPKRQIVDTVELFHLQGQRMLGLRFLAVHLLGMKIQEHTHDSIEDAKTALLLVKKHDELKAAGTLNDKIRELYAIGHAQGFK